MAARRLLTRPQADVADPLTAFNTYKDSTFAMMREAARRGHEKDGMPVGGDGQEPEGPVLPMKRVTWLLRRPGEQWTPSLSTVAFPSGIVLRERRRSSAAELDPHPAYTLERAVAAVLR